MIIQTVNQYDFRQAFADCNRAFNFSYEALDALFEWLEELAEDTGVPYELDVIALCCEFTEYANLAEVQANYSSTKLDTIDDLRDHTSVIEFDGGLIIQDF
jgi:alcohol dehydrogenase class IV